MKQDKIRNLYGLVLVGGKSTRMKTDKASLEFHGKKQFIYCFELLSNFCEQVFISCRKEQGELKEYQRLPQIQDQNSFQNIGPLGGILSAMTAYPQKAWLVLACDLPFVTNDTIQYLIEHRNSSQLATAYKSSSDDLPEPLCAIYEPQAYNPLLAYFHDHQACPRKFLINSKIELLKQTGTMSLNNINNPEDYQNALGLLKARTKIS